MTQKTIIFRKKGFEIGHKSHSQHWNQTPYGRRDLNPLLDKRPQAGFSSAYFNFLCKMWSPMIRKSIQRNVESLRYCLNHRGFLRNWNRDQSHFCFLCFMLKGGIFDCFARAAWVRANNCKASEHTVVNYGKRWYRSAMCIKMYSHVCLHIITWKYCIKTCIKRFHIQYSGHEITCMFPKQMRKTSVTFITSRFLHHHIYLYARHTISKKFIHSKRITFDHSRIYMESAWGTFRGQKAPRMSETWDADLIQHLCQSDFCILIVATSVPSEGFVGIPYQNWGWIFQEIFGFRLFLGRSRSAHSKMDESQCRFHINKSVVFVSAHYEFGYDLSLELMWDLAY